MKKRKDTEESRQFWELAEQTRREVEQWPDWKKGSFMNHVHQKGNVVVTTSNHLTALDDQTVGSKVTNRDQFFSELVGEIRETDFDDQRESGQAYIPFDAAKEHVSCGVGRHTSDPDDYVIRKYRGKPRMFLKRKHAAETESLAVVVYTREAYLKDPDVLRDSAEQERIFNSDYTHVLVAVLASAGDQDSPLSPGRLVHNLAGGNNEAQQWTADEIREKAKEAVEYYEEWATVAD